MKNDVSCILNSLMSLYEHQSTINPNMAFRSFEYCAKLYSKYVTVNELDIYSSNLIRLPAPQCYVFYNGSSKCDDRLTLKLSDAFEVPVTGYEWTVTMLNINKGHNKELLDKCQALNEYSELVQLIRDNQVNNDLFNAVDKAVTEIISRKGVLSKLLDKHRPEVIDVCITEYNEELHERTLKEEGRLEAIRKLIKKNMTKEFILDLDYTEEEYEKALKQGF